MRSSPMVLDRWRVHVNTILPVGLNSHRWADLPESVVLYIIHQDSVHAVWFRSPQKTIHDALIINADFDQIDRSLDSSEDENEHNRFIC